jgi:hypothetical protein
MFNRDYAWWLPKGSIRAVLAIAVVIPTMIVLAYAAEYGMMVGIAIVVINFYFLKDVLGVTPSDDVGISDPIDTQVEYTPQYTYTSNASGDTTTTDTTD